MPDSATAVSRLCIARNSEDYRPLGLGYANLGALLMARGVPYDSAQGRDLAACLTSILTGEAYAQSASIAREIGPFNGPLRRAANTASTPHRSSQRCAFAMRFGFQTAAHDLHSGLYGGAVPNAINTLCHIVAKLKDEQGRIQVPGMYDDVRPLSEELRKQWAALPFDEEEYRKREVGSPALMGEPGFSVLERIGARPTLDANGIIGGFTGEGAKTVIPAVARCKVSMRLVPDQDPNKIWEAFKRYVQDLCPPYATVKVEYIHGAEPVLLPADSPYMKAATGALEEVFGNRTVFGHGGGSIPIVSLFGKVLGAPSILMGLGLPDDNLHAPNEKMKLDNVMKGIEASARFLEMAGRSA